MSIFDNNNENKLQDTISEVLLRITTLFEQITEFKKSKLRNYSLLQNNKYISKLLEFELSNTKHINRKYSKEILTVFKFLSNYIKENDNGFFSNLINRDKI